MTSENKAKGEFDESTDLRMEKAFSQADAQMPGHETGTFKPHKRKAAEEPEKAEPAKPVHIPTKKERDKASTAAWVNLANNAKRAGMGLVLLLVLSAVVWLVGLLRIPGLQSPLAEQGWSKQLQSAVGLSTAGEPEVAVRAIDLEDAPPTEEAKPIIPDIDTSSSVLEESTDGEAKSKKESAAKEDEEAPEKDPAPSVPRDTESAQKAYDQARKLLKKKKLGAAIPLLEKAVEADPLHVESVVLLGSSYASAGVPKKAARAMKAFLELAPSHEEAPRITKLLDGYKGKRKRGGAKKKDRWTEKTLLPK